MLSTLTQLAPFPFPVVKPRRKVTSSELSSDMARQLTRPARCVALRGVGASSKSYSLHRQIIDLRATQEGNLPWCVAVLPPQINSFGWLTADLAQASNLLTLWEKFQALLDDCRPPTNKE